jgi:transcriptional regulator with XRE-family HTH domain
VTDEPIPGDLGPFGPALGRLMDERGLSYRGLASSTGLSGGYLNHLVHGNRPVPSNEVIAHIAAVLDVDPVRFREYRLRVVTARLEALPDLVDRLYRETGS